MRGELVCAFRIAGNPVAQGSKKVVRAGQHHRAIESNDKNLRPWRASIAAAAAEAMDIGDPVRGPVIVEVTFMSARPASHYGTGRNAGTVKASAPVMRATAPDIDKLLRALLDGITGIVVGDDAQVVEVLARKRYGQAGASVRVWVWERASLERMTDETDTHKDEAEVERSTDAARVEGDKLVAETVEIDTDKEGTHVHRVERTDDDEEDEQATGRQNIQAPDAGDDNA